MRSHHILLALFAFSLIAPPVFAHAIGGSDAQFVRNTVGADPFPFLYLGALLSAPSVSFSLSGVVR